MARYSRLSVNTFWGSVTAAVVASVIAAVLLLPLNRQTPIASAITAKPGSIAAAIQQAKRRGDLSEPLASFEQMRLLGKMPRVSSPLAEPRQYEDLNSGEVFYSYPFRLDSISPVTTLTVPHERRDAPCYRLDGMDALWCANHVMSRELRWTEIGFLLAAEATATDLDLSSWEISLISGGRRLVGTPSVSRINLLSGEAGNVNFTFNQAVDFSTSQAVILVRHRDSQAQIRGLIIVEGN